MSRYFSTLNSSAINLGKTKISLTSTLHLAANETKPPSTLLGLINSAQKTKKSFRNFSFLSAAIKTNLVKFFKTLNMGCPWIFRPFLSVPSGIDRQVQLVHR